MFENLTSFSAIAFAGMLAGIFSATGAAIVEIWIKPHLRTIKDDPSKVKEAVNDYLYRLSENMKNGRL